MRKSFRAAAAALFLVTALTPAAAPAQFGALRDVAGRLGGELGVGKVLKGKGPITTALPDAKWGDPSRDGFVPREPKRGLAELQRTPNGGFVLQPGYWAMAAQSYCLHAGTHGPGGGEGYLYAPPEGSAKDAVMTIARNSVNHPEIDQHDIQALLWAILARAKFEDLGNNLKTVAARLLTPRQLASLNRSALDILSGPALQNAIGGVPEPLRTIMEAEADLRRMLTTPGTTFAQLERAAVLAGMAPIGPGSLDIPEGRWSQHPDGYWIRYLPRGYSETMIEIWVPQGSPGVGKEFDPATHIAVPGNTSRQRLLQSGRPRRES
ncbi:hypothetical protein [Sphingosinicella sp. BN140058]|uniref:hypothetical protein n=1 Tax=Sphingosinicella sp. BN140058 TaxID=1892855 RepID=UPI001012D227|nr:hypothetical protein [Sphingosinicella sp. BN140058]QAY75649.1 hypothetical protein ETR14_03215 [Sphingosinicella sp. BN140058]